MGCVPKVQVQVPGWNIVFVRKQLQHFKIYTDSYLMLSSETPWTPTRGAEWGGWSETGQRLWDMIREGQDERVGWLNHEPGCQLHEVLWEAIEDIMYMNYSYLGYFQFYIYFFIKQCLCTCSVQGWIYHGANEGQASGSSHTQDPSKAIEMCSQVFVL